VAPQAARTRCARHVTNLFVYGTLAPGGDAWRRLERWVVGDARHDAAPGILYDTGRGYPGATFAPSTPGRVHGVVVVLAEPDAEALAALDRYEGSEYERVRIRTDGGVDAFTYAWIAPLDRLHLVADGRWTV
jgi:gamma-glutamylcyclotransferase (GGCT)/AIG2-like uncharacterized protein YtfP